MIEKLKGENRLAALNAPAYDETTGRYTVLDFDVDLEQAYWQAVNLKARILEVIADIVRVPEAFSHTLGDDIRMLSIVARSVNVQGERAVLRLKYNKEDARQPSVRILADEIKGKILVLVAGKSKENVKLETGLPSEPLRFISYTCDDKGLVKTQGKLPLAMLDVSKPLYQMLTASFDLAAGAMRKSIASPAQPDLAAPMLKWLVRWAAYPSPYLARLFDDAEALGRLLPVVNEKAEIVRNIPARTPAEYLDLAGSHMNVAKQYELDENFKDVKDTIKQVVGDLVGAWIARDDADSAALDEEIKRAKLLVAESKSAVEKALKMLEDQKFDTTIQGIKLETDLAKDRILKIVKVTFEILQGVVELGVAIASASANPGLVSALTKSNPFTFLNSAASFGEAAPLAQKMGMTIALLYALPKILFDELMAMDGDDKEALGKNASAAGPAVFKLFGAALTLIKIDHPLEVVEKIGDLVSQTTAVPDPIESKAVWEAFQVEAVNQLEMITRDPDATATIISSALAYRTCVQKFAIYGRMYAEQQSLLAQRIRELGTLLIRKAAGEQKQAALVQLKNNLSDRDQAIETLSQLRKARLYELRQTFFAAISKFQAAYYYQNLIWPAKMPAVLVPQSAAEMNEILNDVDSAVKGAKPVKPGDFSKVKEIKKSDDAKFFEDLLANNEAKFTIDLDEQELFANHNQVRINRAHIWLIGASETSITADLLSDTSFHDRLSGSQTFSFSGDPVFISFEAKGNHIEYQSLIEGVCPTPFTTWTLSVKGKDLNIEQVSQVNIEMTGKSVKSMS